MSKAKNVLVGLLALGAVCAQATTYDKTLTSPSNPTFSSATFAATDVIDDTWNFVFAGPKSDASVLLSLSLTGKVTSFAADWSGTPFTVQAADQLTFVGTLDAGNYVLHVTGVAAAPSSYSVGVDLAPVPEPETVALMAMGAIAVFGSARRRRG